MFLLLKAALFFICAVQAIHQQVPGDFLEAGVWRGGLSLLARQVLTTEQQRDRKVTLADSFDGAFVERRLSLKNDSGLPPADSWNDNNLWSKILDLAVNERQVRDNNRRLMSDVNSTVYAKGYFNESIPRLGGDSTPIAVLRLDGDMCVIT